MFKVAGDACENVYRTMRVYDWKNCILTLIMIK